MGVSLDDGFTGDQTIGQIPSEMRLTSRTLTGLEMRDCILWLKEHSNLIISRDADSIGEDFSTELLDPMWQTNQYKMVLDVRADPRLNLMFKLVWG